MTDEIRCPVCGQPIIYTGRRGRRRPAILDAEPRAVAPGHVFQANGHRLTPTQVIDRHPGYRPHTCPPLDHPTLFEPA